MSPSVRAFGKYLLDKEIAQGGMSRVYLARLRGLGGFEKRLVVKQVLPELASDPRFVSMFVTEAKTLVQMSHPHIAPVYELGVVDGVYFLAMEYIEGATLAAILRDGPLSGAAVAHVGAEMADALHYAHSRFQIVHRDVTPGNVMVDPSGHSRLLDFGVATPNEDDGQRELFGTPGYMSPEHLSGSLGPGADVFSLGAVLYQALTCRRAFAAKTVNETRTLLASDAKPSFVPEDQVSAELAGIVTRAMDKDPAVRFRSARDLARALRGWLAQHAPEGVGPDLALRAERATTIDDAVHRVPDEDGVDTPVQPSEVKTLATSPLLQKIFANPSIPPRVDLSGDDDAPGTQPIEGRAGSRPSIPSETPTRAKKNRRPRPRRDRDEDAPVTPARIDPAPREEAEGRPLNLVLYGAIGLVVIAAAVWTAWPSGAVERTSENDDIGAAPDDDPTPTAGERDDPLEEGVPTAPPDPPVDDPATPELSGEERVEDPAIPAPPPQDTLTVTPDRAEPPIGRATLTVSATPWATVYIDGHPVGDTPQRRVPLREGRHTVQLRCPPLGAEVDATFEASAGQNITIHGDLSADPPSIQVR